jgi:branched-chain amino acid transport system substrate-binding protein
VRRLNMPLFSSSLVMSLLILMAVACGSAAQPSPTATQAPVGTPEVTQAATDTPAPTQTEADTPTPTQAMVSTPAPTQAPGGTSASPVKIGTILAFTGDLGNFGPPMRNGADVAVEQINKGGGVLGRPLEIVHRDSGTSSQVSIEAARALINVEGVNAIVGPLGSSTTQSVAQAVTIPNQIVQISPSATSPALTVMEDNDFLFRTTVSDATQGVVLARLAREQGFNTASALYINNAYGEGLANVFKENFESEGGRVIALVPQESGQPSYVSELSRATEDNPDVLVAIGYPESAGVYLREAVEGHFADRFMFVDGTKNQEMFETLGAEPFEGSFGTAPGAPESYARSTFEALYEEKFGELPTNPFIGETFDAVALIALAIEKAGKNDGPPIRDALREVANPPGEMVGPGDLPRALELIRDSQDVDYEGVAGSQNIDENGDVPNTIEIWNIAGGKIVSTGRFESP